MISYKVQERVEEYICLRQTVSSNSVHEKEIRKRIYMGSSTFEKQDLMNRKLLLTGMRKAYNQ